MICVDGLFDLHIIGHWDDASKAIVPVTNLLPSLGMCRAFMCKRGEDESWVWYSNDPFVDYISGKGTIITKHSR